jgi:hypothetical protein
MMQARGCFVSLTYSMAAVGKMMRDHTLEDEKDPGLFIHYCC